jgi:hypothetical protein
LETLLPCWPAWCSGLGSQFASTGVPNALGWESPPFVAKFKSLPLVKMQQLRIPGTMIYVDDPGQGAWTTAMGIGNLASREPMQVNNSMRIGSIIKTLTPTLLQREVTHPVVYW